MLKKSSPLKLRGQMEPNLAGSIYVRSSIKLLHLVPFGQQTWPLLLKIEHMAELQISCVFAFFYAIKTRKNACIIRSECTHYAYILLCKQTFQIWSVLVRC
jgi:hypothetical protein